MMETGVIDYTHFVCFKIRRILNSFTYYKCEKVIKFHKRDTQIIFVISGKKMSYENIYKSDTCPLPHFRILLPKRRPPRLIHNEHFEQGVDSVNIVVRRATIHESTYQYDGFIVSDPSLVCEVTSDHLSYFAIYLPSVAVCIALGEEA
jgi:hypothetical protein